MTGGDQKPGTGSDSGPATKRAESLYFFPDQDVTAARMRKTLESGDRKERAWIISHLLRYAQWDDIWIYVSREEVREIFSDLELPDKLRTAWGRMLKVEVSPVG